MWGQLPQLSATPEVRDSCWRAVSSPVWHTPTELQWGPVLLVTCCCFFLSSGVVCPVSHDVGSQLLPGPHERWKVIFLKGSYLPTLSCRSAGRSQEIWHLELFQVHLGCGWAACCPRHCLGGCLARQILHSVSMEEPCFWCIGRCNPYCSQNVAVGRAKQRQTSTPVVSWLGCPVPPSLRNRAGLSSPISLLGSAEMEQHPRVLVFSCSQTWAGTGWTASSHDPHWSLSEFVGFVFFYPLQFWCLVCCECLRILAFIGKWLTTTELWWNSWNHDPATCVICQTGRWWQVIHKMCSLSPNILK